MREIDVDTKQCYYPRCYPWLISLKQEGKCWMLKWPSLPCAFNRNFEECNMVPLSDKCNLEKKHYPRMESALECFWWGLLVSERAFGETTEPSSLVLKLIYSVWLFWTNEKKIFCLECYNIQYRVRMCNHRTAQGSVSFIVAQEVACHRNPSTFCVQVMSDILHCIL